MNDDDREVCIMRPKLKLEFWWTRHPANQVKIICTFLKLGSSLLVSLGFYGCAFHNYGDHFLSLQMASHGKDVMWIPTKVDVAREMLAAASVNKTDIIYDLGSGDGVIPIEAARKHGVRAVGIEYNPDLVGLSQRNAARAGVEHLASFKRGDIFVEDFSEASVVTLYLGENLNARLMPKLLSMSPGTRIVSNTFRMESWIPDRELRLTSGERAYLWIVPASIDGNWELSSAPAALSGRLSIRQKKQFFDAVLTSKSRTRIFISDGSLNGSTIHFEFVDADNKKYSFSGSVSGDQLSGYLNNDPSLLVSGRRVP
jgi:precorrin-6B methylase 2